jgi:hypothetical protein
VVHDRVDSIADRVGVGVVAEERRHAPVAPEQWVPDVETGVEVRMRIGVAFVVNVLMRVLLPAAPVRSASELPDA